MYWRLIMFKLKQLIKLIRVKHYVKNLLIFFPLVFSKSNLSLEVIIEAIVGFIVFSFMTSIVYVLNDLHDLEDDRNHPIKRKRPLASGSISKSQARIIVVGLLVMILTIETLVHGFKFHQVYLIFYLLINLLYSYWLKEIPILDVSVIVAGFLLRIYYGGELFNISISNWLTLTIIAFSYYLAFGKRRNELQKNGAHSRPVLKYYQQDFLDKMMYVMLSLFIVFYSMWVVLAVSDKTSLIWSIPIVMMIVFRYSLIIESDSYGDPADILFSDKFLLVLSGLFGLYMLLALYVF